MQFGRDFHYILQAIWEADPVQVTVRVSKLDIKDAYHHDILRLSQVVSFAYVVLSAPGDKGCIICINLVLPMVWVE